MKANSKYSIVMIRGDTVNLSINVLDENGKEYEVQQGDTIKLIVKPDVTCDEPSFVKEAKDKVFSIKPEDTIELPVGEYVYGVTLTNAAGDVFTVIPPSRFILDYGVLNQ